jgi:hypothetical protein
MGIDNSTLDELRMAIRGDVLTPADPGYSDKPVYNAMHQPRPALIVRCTGTADVIDAVKFARKRSYSLPSGVVATLLRVIPVVLVDWSLTSRGCAASMSIRRPELRACRAVPCGATRIARRRHLALSYPEAWYQKPELRDSRSAAVKVGSAASMASRSTASFRRVLCARWLGTYGLADLGT